MIKNVIFDVGDVLVDWRWCELFEQLGFEEDMFDAMAEATVWSKRWQMWDKGQNSDEDIIQMMKDSAPMLEIDIENMIEHIPQSVEPFYYAKQWIMDLKNRGYHVYILSNYNHYMFERNQKELDFTELVDGAIFSFQVGHAKPEPEIYQELLTRYDLKANECVFLDDRMENLEGAKKFGIETILFRDYEEAVDKLEAVLS